MVWILKWWHQANSLFSFFPSCLQPDWYPKPWNDHISTEQCFFAYKLKTQTSIALVAWFSTGHLSHHWNQPFFKFQADHFERFGDDDANGSQPAPKMWISLNNIIPVENLQPCPCSGCSQCLEKLEGRSCRTSRGEDQGLLGPEETANWTGADGFSHRFLTDFSQISHRSLTDFTVSVYRKPQSESQNTLW